MQRLSLMVLRTGPIPRHIAFIMDGNRRFARKSKVGTVHGHSKGFDKLSEVLQWCLDMGVQEVTVYAFSIENFKRSKEEVDGIFDLARDKFRRLLSEKDKLMELGIRVEVIGNLNLFPKDIIETIAEAMTETRNNNRAVLSVAFAYTSRDEITHSIETILTGVDQQQIDTKDIDEELISRCLYTKNRPTPEILIRSSGETRLSDFLLWQVTMSNKWSPTMIDLNSFLLSDNRILCTFRERSVARIQVLAPVDSSLSIPTIFVWYSWRRYVVRVIKAAAASPE